MDCRYDVLASDTEVSTNYVLVDEDGTSIDPASLRSAEDFAVYNESCQAKNNPDKSCQGRNIAYSRSTLRPPCMDNNSSLDVTNGCYAVNGTWLPQCIQVAYTSNTFIPQCGIDAEHNCGTYLEIHIAHGTPYTNEKDIIADVKVDQRNVSGYYTTVMPINWMGNTSKILCSYTENAFRIGSLAYVKPSAPVCCCPPSFQGTTRVGSFFCPIGPTDDGPFAYRLGISCIETHTLLCITPMLVGFHLRSLHRA